MWSEMNNFAIEKNDFIALVKQGGKSGLRRAPHRVKSPGVQLKNCTTDRATETNRLRVRVKRGCKRPPQILAIELAR
ncbi:MAG: hypothetical protein RL609_406 [Bacteroidota bacterium]